MKILLIDDVRSPSDIEDGDIVNGKTYAQNKHSIEIAKTAEAGTYALSHNVYDILLLDHDLGEGKNGSDVLDFIEQNPEKAPKTIRLVTANIVAGPLMLNRLNKLKNKNLIKECSWIRPFRGAL
jgi:CheY-like chemotaxis protein